MYQKIAGNSNRGSVKKGSWFETHKKEYYILFFLLAFTLAKISGADKLLGKFIFAFVPLIIGVAIAFILTPVIDWFHSRGLRRSIAKFITLGATLIVLGLALGYMIPYIIEQVTLFANGMLGDRDIALSITEYLEGFGGDNIDFSKHIFAGVNGTTEIIISSGELDDWLQFIPDLTNKFVEGGTESGWKLDPHGIWGWFDVTTKSFVDVTATTPKAFLGETWSGTGNFKTVTLGIGALYKVALMLFEATGNTSASLISGYSTAVFEITDFSQYGAKALDILSIIGTIGFVTMLAIVIAFFLLDSYKGLMHWVSTHAIPNKKSDREEVAKAIHDSIVSWLKGVTIDFIVIFSMTALILWVTGMITDEPGQSIKFREAAIMYGLLMAICNLIPMIGPFIGMVPISAAGILIYAETGNITPLLMALGGAVIIQTLESNVLIPLIYGRSTNLHPITILIGLSVFGAMFGFLGMFLTIPTLATVKAVGRVKGYKIKI